MTPVTYLLLLLSVLPAAAATPVEVIYADPATYTDAGTRPAGSAGQARVQAALSAHFAWLGARYLAPGRRLTITIKDIDLAGRIEPWWGQAFDLRVLREITWPRIELHFRLLEADHEVLAGDATIADLDYLRSVGGYRASDPLVYEKRMLERWFRARFAAGQPRGD